MWGMQADEITKSLNKTEELFGYKTELLYNMLTENVPQDVVLKAKRVERAWHPMGCDIFHLIVEVPMDYYVQARKPERKWTYHIIGIQDTGWYCQIYQPNYLGCGDIKAKDILIRHSV